MKSPPAKGFCARFVAFVILVLVGLTVVEAQ